jgi:uncharacterized protein YndB with AHSA1/START domain
MTTSRQQTDDLPRTIQQSVEFPGATPERLYAMYVDPALHAAAIGAPVSISDRPGAAFWASEEGGGVRGRNLALVPARMIVQLWRAANWRDEDDDSILTLLLLPAPGGARVELVQANVPGHACETIERGW